MFPLLLAPSSLVGVTYNDVAVTFVVKAGVEVEGDVISVMTDIDGESTQR